MSPHEGPLPPEARSTIPADPSARRVALDKALRRVTVVLVVGAALAGASSLLGVRTATVADFGDGYELEVRYALVSRAGLETPLTIDVRSESSLPEEVTVWVDTAYLSLFDENGLDPQPVLDFADADRTEWTFEVPPGRDALSVDFDARLSPAAQWGRDGDVALVVDGREVARVAFRTWVMP